jgi:hypothetical protein
MSIGDWGDEAAKNVAPVMAEYSPEFILAIGDNFYDRGSNSSPMPSLECVAAVVFINKYNMKRCVWD